MSRTVALSIPQGAGASGVNLTSSRNADRSLTVIISGPKRARASVRLPVQVRSNTAYKLFVKAKAGGSNLSSLLVVGARPTGNLVFGGAAEDISVAAAFDGRADLDKSTPARGSDRPNLSALSELLRGPAVSRGGTLESPQNALEVVLSVTVEPREGGRGWTVELLLSPAPAEG